MAENTLTEPTLFSAAWRYRWLVALIIAVAVALGFGYLAVFPPQTLYVAQADMVVQAIGGGLDIGTAGNPERFVANQVEILTSAATFQLASDRAAESGVTLAPEDLEEGILVGSSNNSDLINVAFVALDPVAAVTGANALAAAYEELVSLETISATAAALERIDGQLDTLDGRAESLETQIEALLASDTVRADLQTQYEEAVVEIVQLQAEAANASEDRLIEIRARLGDLRLLIDTYQNVLVIREGSGELAALQREEDQILARRATLAERRDQLSVDLELAPAVVAFRSDAQAAEIFQESGPGRVLAVSLVLGLVAGVALAYLLASRRRVFHDRTEPEGILGAPLLADIPDFAEEGLKTRLPVRDQPRSAAAEAFRFAATSLELKMASQQAKSLVVIAATLGTGKSTVLANLALAAAREGNRVLLVDADFGNQDLTALLTEERSALSDGLTDVISAGMPFMQAIRLIDIGPDLRLSLLSRGRQPVVAADLLRSPQVRQLFDTVREEFDLVLVDAPPLLQVAYTSTLSSYVDGAVVVVAHRGSAGQLEEVKSRLSLIGGTALGYLYNRSPLRREMTFTEGSMTDILGDMGVSEQRDSYTAETARTRKKSR